MDKPTGRRNFVKHSLAAAGAACIASAGPAILNASDVREGLDISKLEGLKDQLAARQTTGLLVRRHNRTVYEWYVDGWGPEKPHYAASMSKSLVGGRSLLLALDEGRIAADDSAWKYIPFWKHENLKSRITIRQLATHTSGLEDAEEGGKPHSELTGWEAGESLMRRNPGGRGARPSSRAVGELGRRTITGCPRNGSARAGQPWHWCSPAESTTAWSTMPSVCGASTSNSPPEAELSACKSCARRASRFSRSPDF
ncbi:MAG TPA: serine hydrolase domain-containing protein [Terriglobia bacterium]|nr:serine hydrolase domain-containing protein [Terriglobia bacterium]